jgi:hypothetical protein
MPETVKFHTPATDRDIRAILGPTDDELVFIIQETGASRDEVLRAFTWLSDDDYMGAGLQRPISSRVRAVYEILREEQDGQDEH